MIAELTLSNLKSYASAAMALALKLLDLEREGYADLVVPSRGAAPFARWASSYFHQVWKPDLQTKEERIAAVNAHLGGPLADPFYLPFTADFGDEIDGIESRDIRRYWTYVLAAAVRGDYEDPYFRLFDFLRAEVCPTSQVHRHLYTPPSSRFVFLDTVVSGRAIAEIMDAFDECGLDGCHFILIVDASGARLRQPYARRIEDAVRSGRATRIDVDRLFTEDQGPAVSGIWSVVMPEFMEVARNEIPALTKSGATGSGLYYTEVRAREDASNLPATIAISRLSGLVPMAWDGHVRDAWIEAELGRLRDHLEQTKLIRPSATLDLAKPRLLADAKVPMRLDVSSSHALRFHVSKDVAANKIASLRDWSSPLAEFRRPELWPSVRSTGKASTPLVKS